MSAIQPIHESSLKSFKLLHRGKVRDLYAVDAERLLIVQTDRLSAFDVILPTPVPGKGRVLTEMSNFWFRKLRHVIPNHLLDVTPEISTRYRLSLYRDVYPLMIKYIGHDRDYLLQEAEDQLVSAGLVSKGDLIVITFGEPIGAPGGTNTMKIVKVGESRKP